MIETINLLSTISASDALQTSWNFLSKGGYFMIPLSITSIVGMTAILYKFLSLSRSRVIPTDLAHQLANFQNIESMGRIDPVLKELENGESTLARLAAVVVKHREKPQRDIIFAVESSARQEASRMHAGISVLDIVIAIAPLLGLLGTAAGLVTIFQGLSDSADHIAIARGISEALNTTIFGIAIAVPCIVAHGYFTRRIEVLSAQLETQLADFVSAFQSSSNHI